MTIILAVVLAFFSPAPTDTLTLTPPAGSDIVTLSPCLTEDQVTDCYWDASERGNGTGTDFIILDGWVWYPGENIER